MFVNDLENGFLDDATVKSTNSSGPSQTTGSSGYLSEETVAFMKSNDWPVETVHNATPSSQSNISSYNLRVQPHNQPGQQSELDILTDFSSPTTWDLASPSENKPVAPPPDIVLFASTSQTTNGRLRSDSDRINSLEEEDLDLSENEAAPLIEMDLIPRDLAEEKNLNKFPDDPEYMCLVQDAQNAIEQGILPELIAQGSSGSYFVRNVDREIIGVFKPKSEEPYGKMNPKVTKWLHKMCCPCCFGRDCLIPNQGYLSEAAASVVDKKLHLNVVPNTHVVWLASESFNYTRLERAKSHVKKNIMAKTPAIGKKFHRLGLPLKAGSFQQFATNCKPSDQCLKTFGLRGMTPQSGKSFQLEFEKLVVLDYIIRNTDRGNDNWLIRLDNQASASSSYGGEKRHQQSDSGMFSAGSSSGPEGDVLVRFEGGASSDKKGSNRNIPAPSSYCEGGEVRGEVKIAAIDNGLAFPFKHPDSWRMYPYHWVWLPYSKEPFSKHTTDLVLPLITDMTFVEDLCEELEALFRLDSGFDKRLFERQMSVMRGQLLNLSHALKEGKSPLQLVQMPLSVVERRRHASPSTSSSSSSFPNSHHEGPGTSSGGSNMHSAKTRIRNFSDHFIQSFQKSKPFFSWW